MKQLLFHYFSLFKFKAKPCVAISDKVNTYNYQYSQYIYIYKKKSHLFHGLLYVFVQQQTNDLFITTGSRQSNDISHQSSDVWRCRTVQFHILQRCEKIIILYTFKCLQLNKRFYFVF